jgi:hypothetical protein
MDYYISFSVVWRIKRVSGGPDRVRTIISALGLMNGDCAGFNEAGGQCDRDWMLHSQLFIGCMRSNSSDLFDCGEIFSNASGNLYFEGNLSCRREESTACQLLVILIGE